MLGERLGVGEYKSAQRAFLAKFNPEERKKYEHDFYDMAIQITDKKLNIDELVQRYVNVDQIDKSNRQERKALKTVGSIDDFWRDICQPREQRSVFLRTEPVKRVCREL